MLEFATYLVIGAPLLGAVLIALLGMRISDHAAAVLACAVVAAGFVGGAAPT